MDINDNIHTLIPLGYSKGVAKCLNCKHEIDILAKQGEYEFRCPVCETDTAVWKHTMQLMDGVERYVCGCGSDTFAVVPGKIVCICCSKYTPLTDLLEATCPAGLGR